MSTRARLLTPILVVLVAPSGCSSPDDAGSDTAPTASSGDITLTITRIEHGT